MKVVVLAGDLDAEFRVGFLDDPQFHA